MSILESKIEKVRVIFILNVFISLWWIISYGLAVSAMVYIFIVFFMMNGIGIVLSFHRYYAHKSFKFRNNVLEIFALILGTLSCSGSGLGWAGIHRAHHKFSDTDNDPHSAERGLWAMLSLNYNQDFSPRLIIDLYKNKLLMWFHTYYFVPIAIYITLLYTLFGAEYVVTFFCIPSSLSVIAEGMTNYINHKDKDEYKASNVWWMNLFSFGDGWHKNHHDRPTAWTTHEEWYQFDLIGVFIKYIFAGNIK